MGTAPPSAGGSAKARPPSESGPAPGTRPPFSARSRDHFVPVYLAVAGVVVMVLLAPLLLWIGGTGPGTPSGSSGGALTYAEAKAISDATLRGLGGSGWSLRSAGGLLAPSVIEFPSTLRVVENSSLGQIDCLTLPGPANLSVPGSVLNRTLGLASFWEFEYGSPSSAAEIAVVDGTPHVLFDVSGTCGTLLTQGFLPVPAESIDSPVAGASSAPWLDPLLHTHPDPTATYLLSGGFTLGGNASSPAAWSVGLTTCRLGATGPSAGDYVYVGLNATTGSVMSHLTLNGSSCPGSPGIGASLSFGNPSVNASGSRTTVTFPVVAAGHGITWANLSATLENSTLAPFPSGWNLTAEDSTGAPIAQYGVAAGNWSAGGSQPIAVGNELFLELPAGFGSGSLGGTGFLILTGVGGYAGSLSLIF